MTLARLTECERMVMKAIWDAGEEMGLMEILKKVNEEYHRDWKPQTVATFLARLEQKGYLEHYSQKRGYVYRILVPLEEYVSQLTGDYVDFWNHNNADEFLYALAQGRPLRQDEIERICALIDGLDE